MATMKDISREAGVSEAVVSAVLSRTNGRIKASPATEEKIRQIAARLNYRPNLVARRLAGKKSGIIGVAMDSCAPQPYHTRLSQMEIHAAGKGYRFMIGQTHNDIPKIKEYARYFTDYGVDGIICMAHNYPGRSQEIAEYYLSCGKTVFFERPEGIADCYSVNIDVAWNFQHAAEYLAAANRRRIGFLRLDDFYAGPTMEKCQAGYRRGLESGGLSFDPALIQGVGIDDMKNIDAVMPRIKNLLHQGVDAIIAVNDLLAAATLKCLTRLDISVPGRVAVTGCDDLDVAVMTTPELTTFDQHNELVAKTLVDLLIDQIENRLIPPDKRHITVQPTFIKRNSA